MERLKREEEDGGKDAEGTGGDTGGVAEERQEQGQFGCYWKSSDVPWGLETVAKDGNAYQRPACLCSYYICVPEIWITEAPHLILYHISIERCPYKTN